MDLLLLLWTLIGNVQQAHDLARGVLSLLEEHEEDIIGLLSDAVYETAKEHFQNAYTSDSLEACERELTVGASALITVYKIINRSRANHKSLLERFFGDPPAVRACKDFDSEPRAIVVSSLLSVVYRILGNIQAHKKWRDVTFQHLQRYQDCAAEALNEKCLVRYPAPRPESSDDYPRRKTSYDPDYIYALDRQKYEDGLAEVRNITRKIAEILQ